MDYIRIRYLQNTLANQLKCLFIANNFYRCRSRLSEITTGLHYCRNTNQSKITSVNYQKFAYVSHIYSNLYYC